MGADPLTGAEATALVAGLSARGETVATSESLTAGLLAAMIAGVPGASAVLRGGLIVYATDLKSGLAGVREDTLAQFGPVAAQTARELAVGALRRCQATYGISLTGVAGPDPQDGKVPGTVFCGLARVAGDVAERSSTGLAGDVAERSSTGVAGDVAERSSTGVAGDVAERSTTNSNDMRVDVGNVRFDTRVVPMSLSGDRWDIRLVSCTRSIAELLDWLQ